MVNVGNVDKNGRRKKMSNFPGKKLQTLEEFNSVISKKNGFVVITDVSNPTKIHFPSCPRLKEDYFFEKMVENDGKYGLYLWYESRKESQIAHPDSVNCRFCDA